MCVWHTEPSLSKCSGLSQTPFFEHRCSYLCAVPCLDRALFLETDAQRLLAELRWRLPGRQPPFSDSGTGAHGSALGPQGCTQTACWGAPHSRCCPPKQNSVVAPE